MIKFLIRMIEKRGYLVLTPIRNRKTTFFGQDGEKWTAFCWKK